MITEDPIAKVVLEKAFKSTRSMCKLFFPEIFRAPFSTLHDQIFELVDTKRRKIAIAAPRGLGKTSIARALASHGILFRDRHFIVYISNSATLAEMQTENIKRELLSNKVIRQLFGNIKASDLEDFKDDQFSKMAWVAFGNTLVLPRGSGQQVRGLNWANYRPDLVIIDDLEDKDEVRNVENRKKLKEWFFSDVMKTEDSYGEPATFIYIDTVKHEDSLLEVLLEAPEWSSVRLSICDENYNTYDENYMTTEEIKEEIKQHRQKGLMDLFYMERMNIPISTEDAVFKNEYFHYYIDYGDELVIKVTSDSGEVVEERVPSKRLLHVTICDPAKSVQMHSDESAIVTIGVDRESHKIFIRDIFSGKVRPDELYKELFRQVVKWKSMILGVEVTGLSLFISQPIENEMRVRAVFPTYIELKAGGVKKEERISGLAPLYKLGYVYHNASNCGVLETQLRGFPRSKYWDVMDATAYINKIMDELDYYFDPPDLGEDEEAEFRDLEHDKPIANWRVV